MDRSTDRLRCENNRAGRPGSGARPDTIEAYVAKADYLEICASARTRRSTSPRPVSPSIQICPSLLLRALAEIGLGRFEQAKSDLRQAMRLSLRDPRWVFGFPDRRCGTRTGPLRCRDRRMPQGNRSRFSNTTCTSKPRRRIRAPRQDGRGEARFGGSPPPQSQSHDEMENRAFAELAEVSSKACARRGCRRNERQSEPRTWLG